jgi:hypothetical protein
MEIIGSDHGVMVGTKKREPIRRRPRRKIEWFIVPWIRAMGFTPAYVAKKIERNEGYFSQLGKGTKFNPSEEIRDEIAGVIGVPTAYFRRPPPTLNGPLSAAADIEPAILRKLLSVAQARAEK